MRHVRYLVKIKYQLNFIYDCNSSRPLPTVYWTMSLLGSHLEQIQLCSSTIEQLPFAAPKMFTNAMLHTNDITSLIRDTEAHERALFSPTTGEEDADHKRRTGAASKRKTIPFSGQEEPDYDKKFHAPRKGSAVAAILGGDLSHRIQREYQRDTQENRRDRRQQGDNFDVELLLTGAERLCSA